MGATSHPSRRTLITTPNDTDLRMERSFDAPRERVYRAYTDPALLVRWLGPRRLKMRIDEMDVRPGGRWRFVHVDEDGSEYGFHGEFLGIRPNERISQTWIFEGHPEAAALEMAEFVERDGRTTVVSTARYLLKEHRDSHLQSGMEEGVEEGYDRLDELLRTMR